MPDINGLTNEEKLTAESLLVAMRVAQTELWDRSLEFEQLVGVDIDTNWDMEDETVESLLEKGQPNDAGF